MNKTHQLEALQARFEAGAELAARLGLTPLAPDTKVRVRWRTHFKAHGTVLGAEFGAAIALSDKHFGYLVLLDELPHPGCLPNQLVICSHQDVEAL